ncbi:hypothetical protein K1T71_008149 [Dendrolimus kikuchii]|uniref:Uncharacterized protein n=1 Tax=Dendrolimus kikuchii TaxID=765133 RepID=A0ACC1CWP1_9NEOP|nr:hypothetical protein K1T71_008149 [Dendrolimus kikuchii]
MSVTKEQQQIMCVLEDTATLLQKTQINLEKCPKARLTKGYIEARINIIDGYWKTFKETHQELVKITPKELKRTLPYFLNEEFFVYEELYNVMQGDLKDMLSSMAEAYTNAKSLHSFHNSSQQSDTLVHLPKIQIPTFHGNYEVWPAFKELFTSLLHYLKTSLAGEAESLLKHIQVTSSNYLIAWDILNTRYGNKRLLLNSTMNRLFNQKKMATQSAIHLKSLLDTTMECLHNFETLNIPTASWDPIIIFLLVQKLDPETHKCWEEYAYKEESENKMPTWSNFKKFIESKFRTLELVTTNTKEFKQVKERSFHVAISETRKVCFMCHDNHTLSHCQGFIQMETKERRKYVKNKHLCFNCLIPGHTVYKCKLRVSCQICNRRHHSLLHETKNTECVALSSTPEPIGSQHVAREGEVQVNTMIASHLTSSEKTALLATAMVGISNEQGDTTQLRVLIDQGSQASFISQRAARLLNLKELPVQGSVAGMGCTKVGIQNVVQLQIRSQWEDNYVLPVQAYVMSKKLTTKIPAKTIYTQSWPHLSNLNLADPFYFAPGSIDLLLGVKEYVQILEHGLIKGSPGTPCAQKTRLGWIVFGEICENPREETYFVMHHQIDIERQEKKDYSNIHSNQEERLHNYKQAKSN